MTPRPWSVAPSPPASSFDVHPDGKRLFILQAVEAASDRVRTHATLVVRFGDELRRTATPGR